MAKTGYLRSTALAMAAALALGTAAPTAVLAQAQAPAADAPAISPQDIDQAQLDAFASAAIRVSDIAEDWEGRLDSATDEAESMQLREEMGAEMAAAVEAEGLTIEEYNLIFQVAQADPEVNATVVEMMQQKGG